MCGWLALALGAALVPTEAPSSSGPDEGLLIVPELRLADRLPFESALSALPLPVSSPPPLPSLANRPQVAANNQRRWQKEVDANYEVSPEKERPVHLSSVDCIRVLTLEGSSQLQRFRDGMEPYGLWERTTVQVEDRDTNNSHRGVWNAHQRAWRESGECNHLLVFEDDCYFENATAVVGMQRVEMFLRSNIPYDFVLLGWAFSHSAEEALNVHDLQALGSTPRVVPIRDQPCMYSIDHWADMQ